MQPAGLLSPVVVVGGMDHHYVPQFLLRAWANASPDDKLEVFRLDLKYLPSRRTGPKYTAFEPNLYALSIPAAAGIERQAVETKLMRHIDSDAAVVHVKMCETGLRSLTAEERSKWVRFLISLRVRHPEAISALKLDGDIQLRHSLQNDHPEYLASIEPGDPPTMVEWTEREYPGLIESFGLTCLAGVMNDPKVGNDLLRMRWSLWDFSQWGHNLVLADRPCVMTQSLAHPDCILALPISPVKAFFATRGERAATFLRRTDPKQIAVRLNESSVAQARVRVFSRDASARRFIANRLRHRALTV
jgi:hypothetical protein